MKATLRLLFVIVTVSAPLGVALPADAVCGACGSYSEVLACFGDANANSSCRVFRCMSEGGLGGVQWAYCCDDDIPCVV